MDARELQRLSAALESLESKVARSDLQSQAERITKMLSAIISIVAVLGLAVAGWSTWDEVKRFALAVPQIQAELENLNVAAASIGRIEEQLSTINVAVAANAQAMADNRQLFQQTLDEHRGIHRKPECCNQ